MVQILDNGTTNYYVKIWELDACKIETYPEMENR